MASIRAVSTVLPKYEYSRDDICKVGDAWLSDAPHQRDLFLRFVSSSQISRRHFAIPLEQILGLTGAGERSKLFQSYGRPLLKDVAALLLQNNGTNAQDIDHLIFTSCSAPVIPSIDVGLVDDLEFRRSVNRIPVYQHGCAGGVIGLAIASRVLKPKEKAILAAVELCSLVYQARDLTGGNLVGSAIFGDGAAAVLLDSDESAGLRIVDSCSHLVPDSAALMGYNSEDDGPHLRLDRALPQALTENAPPFLRSFLAKQQLQIQDIKWWLFHPGGVKVLAALENALNINRDRSRWSWEVLERFGNMSSCSILFVIESFLRSEAIKPGELACVVGVGPGLTIEAVLLQAQ